MTEIKIINIMLNFFQLTENIYTNLGLFFVALLFSIWISTWIISKLSDTINVSFKTPDAFLYTFVVLTTLSLLYTIFNAVFMALNWISKNYWYVLGGFVAVVVLAIVVIIIKQKKVKNELK